PRSPRAIAAPCPTSSHVWRGSVPLGRPARQGFAFSAQWWIIPPSLSAFTALRSPGAYALRHDGGDGRGRVHGHRVGRAAERRAAAAGGLCAGGAVVHVVARGDVGRPLVSGAVDLVGAPDAVEVVALDEEVRLEPGAHAVVVAAAAEVVVEDVHL